jgi:hypothetical protein
VIAQDERKCPRCGLTKTSDCFYDDRLQCKVCVKAVSDATKEKNIAELEGKEEITEKKCSKCRIVHPIIYFTKSKGSVDGFHRQCLLCKFVPNMIHNAKVRNQYRIDHDRPMPPVSVTVEHINSLEKICAYSKEPVVFHPGHVNVASLDRIDDNDGYTIANSQLVNIRFNTRAKWTHEKFSNAFGPEWESFIELSKETRMSPQTLIDGWTLSDKLKGLARPSKGRTFQLIMDMWELQDGLCYYSGIPMTWGKIDKSSWTVSVERLYRGNYNEKNTRLVCAEFNSIEYHTDRFEHLFNGVPQGWNREVVQSYRTTNS